MFEIARRLETDHVIGEQCIEQIVGDGNLLPLRRCGERYVQEEAHGLRYPKSAQLTAHRDQVEIVHPDQILRLQPGSQRSCVAAIHALVRERLA